MDSAAPHAVNGGLRGHGVFCQGAGPAGSAKVPVGTQTPVKPRSAAVLAASGRVRAQAVRIARRAAAEAT